MLLPRVVVWANLAGALIASVGTLGLVVLVVLAVLGLF